MQLRTHRVKHLAAATFFVLAVAALTAIFAGGVSILTQPHKALASAAHSPLTSTIPLLINEVYDASSPSNNANEFVELVNTSASQTIDLSGYQIWNSDNISSSGRIGITPLSLLPPELRLIGPGQHLAIGPTQLGTDALVGNGLANYDYLALVSNASDVPIDLVNWGTTFPNPSWNGYARFHDYFFRTTPPLMPSPDGPNSLSRFPDGVDTDTSGDWRSLPLSPGFPNTAPTATPGGTTPTIGCEDRYEPDDTLGTAKEIVQNTDQVHTFCHNDSSKDRDWLFFPAVSGKLYTMLTKDLTGPVDTVITLYNSNGQALAENDDYVPGQGLSSRIDYTFSASGTYYLQVRDKRANGGLGYQYTVSLISTGQLPPTTTTTPSPTFNPNAPTVTTTPGICRDAYEPDGVPETARNILIGTTQHHSICPTGDADWVRFYARAGKVYTLRTSNLGVGLDTYIILFGSDMHTILAENDDGGDGVASRIDFYPQKDDWYFLQVKNAGDIGEPDLVYDLSLAVVPGVPQPPGTATAIIAPPVTVTAIPSGPTTTAVATKPPVPTPTAGAAQPTPTAKPTLSAAQTEETPVQTVLPQSGTRSPTETLPNVPKTGAESLPAKPKKLTVSVAKPAQQPSGSTALASVLFRVFYDANRNETYDTNEGIRGLKVYFLSSNSADAISGQLVTSDVGTGNLTLPVVQQKIFIPYFGINVPLTKFPERELHSLWLQHVALPDRVP